MICNNLPLKAYQIYRFAPKCRSIDPDSPSRRFWKASPLERDGFGKDGVEDDVENILKRLEIIKVKNERVLRGCLIIHNYQLITFAVTYIFITTIYFI